MSDSHASGLDTSFVDEGGHPWWSAFVSSWGLILLLSVVGAGVAGYLTYVHFDDSVLVCTADGGCHTVQESDYATIGPIPIALLGLGMFLTLAGLAFARIRHWSFISDDLATMATWGITLSALFYYAYLVYVELFVLEAICQWCVVTTVLTVIIFVVATFRLRDTLAIDEEDLAVID